MQQLEHSLVLFLAQLPRLWMSSRSGSRCNLNRQLLGHCFREIYMDHQNTREYYKELKISSERKVYGDFGAVMSQLYSRSCGIHQYNLMHWTDSRHMWLVRQRQKITSG